MKLKAVMVMEILNGEILSSHAFSEDPKGNQEANDIFTKIYMEHKADHDEDEGVNVLEPTEVDFEDIRYCIDGGVYDDDNGYQLVIVHTTE